MFFMLLILSVLVCNTLAACPSRPDDRYQCKRAGWLSYGDFCIRYFGDTNSSSVAKARCAANNSVLLSTNLWKSQDLDAFANDVRAHRKNNSDVYLLNNAVLTVNNTANAALTRFTWGNGDQLPCISSLFCSSSGQCKNNGVATNIFLRVKETTACLDDSPDNTFTNPVYCQIPKDQ